MPELDAFERSLATAFREFADRGVVPVDAVEFTSRVAARPRVGRAWLPWPAATLRGGWSARHAILVAAAVALLLAAAVGGALVGARLFDPSPRTAPPADSMIQARVRHTATLLEDGRVLLVGGDGLAPASAELYDPTTGAFSPTDAMVSDHRLGHSAIRLGDGRVLIIGGAPSFDAHRREIWDPGTGRFRIAGVAFDGSGVMVAPVIMDMLGVMAAGPLADGRILVKSDGSTTAELFDPVSGTEVTTGSIAVAPKNATATLLLDGRVLITGFGSEVYDPKTGEFTATGSTSAYRAGHTTTVLADGRVLILGVWSRSVNPLASAEIWDPETGRGSATGSMITPRAKPVATLLADGRVLVTGGGDAITGTDLGEASVSAELYDPATGTFSPTGSMAVPRTGHTATLLRDGTVLIAGGAVPYLDPVEGVVRVDDLASAELYNPETGTFTTVGQR